MLGLLTTGAAADGQLRLTPLERQIEEGHTGVASLLPHQAHELLKTGEGVILLDVREASEYDVSRIPGALRVDPGMSADQFVARFGGDLAGRSVLLYCSVGVRSSRLGERIRAEAMRRGVAGVYNIRGGIFAWHNYGKRLDAEAGRTELVHPYSPRWSRYLDFPNYTSYGRSGR